MINRLSFLMQIRRANPTKGERFLNFVLQDLDRIFELTNKEGLEVARLRNVFSGEEDIGKQPQGFDDFVYFRVIPKRAVGQIGLFVYVERNQFFGGFINLFDSIHSDLFHCPETIVPHLGLAKSNSV